MNFMLYTSIEWCIFWWVVAHSRGKHFCLISKAISSLALSSRKLNINVLDEKIDIPIPYKLEPPT